MKRLFLSLALFLLAVPSFAEPLPVDCDDASWARLETLVAYFDMNRAAPGVMRESLPPFRVELGGATDADAVLDVMKTLDAMLAGERISGRRAENPVLTRYVQPTGDLSPQALRQARAALYADLAGPVNGFFEANRGPRNLIVKAASGRAVATFDGMPGHEYEVSLLMEGVAKGDDFQLQTVSSETGACSATFDYTLADSGDVLVVFVDDGLAGLSSARTREFPGAITASIESMEMFGVSGESSRKISDVLYDDEGVKVVLRVRSDTPSAPARVWLQEPQGGRILDVETEFSETRNGEGVEYVFILESPLLRKARRYEVCAQMMAPVSDTGVTRVSLACEARPQ